MLEWVCGPGRRCCRQVPLSFPIICHIGLQPLPEVGLSVSQKMKGKN